MTPEQPDDSLHPSQDSNFLTRLKRRDPVAWGCFVEVFHPTVYSWCRRRGLGEAEAEDVSQNVFLSLFERGYPFQAGSTRKWLGRVVRNAIIDHYRSHQREIPAGWAGADADPFEVVAAPAEPDSEFARALFAFPGRLGHVLALVRDGKDERHWRAFWRVYVDGIAVDIVAEELSLTPGNVYQIGHRVLSELIRLRRELYGDDHGNAPD